MAYFTQSSRAAMRRQQQQSRGWSRYSSAQRRRRLFDFYERVGPGSACRRESDMMTIPPPRRFAAEYASAMKKEPFAGRADAAAGRFLPGLISRPRRGQALAGCRRRKLCGRRTDYWREGGDVITTSEDVVYHATTLSCRQ